MKKTIYLFCLLGLLFGSKNLSAQIATFVVSPQNQCFSAGGATATAYVTSPIPGATSYSWNIASNSCTASINTFSNGSIANITYPCCGIYTIACLGFSNTVLIASAVQTTTVSCQPVLSISGNTTVCAGDSAIITASGANTYTWYTSNGNYFGPTIVFSPTATTCYSVAGSNSSGCTSNFIGGCISVLSGGSPTIISNNFNICSGSTTVLHALGASSYTWLPGGSTSPSIAVSPTATSCYTLLGSGCSGIGSTVRCVTVSTAPVISISGNTAVCSGNSTTLTASGANTYTWYTGTGTYTGSSIALTPTTTTCYSIVAANSQGCYAYSGGCVGLMGNTLNVTGNTNICSGSSATLTASGAQTYTWLPGNLIGSSIVVSPTASTCYTVIGYAQPGCSSAGFVCVSVSSGASPTITSNNFNICSGSTTVLHALGASSYTWLPGGSISPSIAVSPTATSCYTLLGSGCQGIGSTVRCVTVSTAPVLSISGNTAICAGNGATLTASGANTYTWYTGFGTFTNSTIAFTPSATTCFSLVGTNSAGCMGYSGGCVSVNAGSSPTISGNASICLGAYTTLYASGASNYTWLPGGTTDNSLNINPASTTCYTLLGIGCSGIVSTSKCVTVSTVPAPNLSISGNLTICAGFGTTLTASGASSYTWITNAGTYTGSTIALTPTASTCFTLVGSNGSGCTASLVNCITVSPLNNIAINGNASTCSGGQTILFASGSTNYTWLPGGSNSPSIAVNPSVTTCYTLSGMGCSGIVSTVKCVTVSTIPAPNISIAGNLVVCAGSTTTLTASGANSYTWITSQGTYTGSTIFLNPTASTCFSVIGSNNSACLGSTYACITVIPSNSISISGNANICQGSTTSLFASGGTSYTWMPGGSNSSSITITPTTTTCYTVSAIGCSGIISAVKCVTVSPAPVISISGNTTICFGNSTTLTASGASSYTWMTGVGTFTGSSIVLSPTVTTCFTVAASNGQGCYSYSGGCVNVVGGNIFITGNTSICPGSSTTLTANGAQTYTWLPVNQVGSSIVVSPTVATCYTVLGYSQPGCIGSGLACVSILSGGSPTISGNFNICSGGTAILQASGSNSYTWLPGGSTSPTIAVSPTTTSCYTLVGSGCSGINATVRCVTVGISPVISVSGSNSVCAGGTVTLTASGANSYTWNTSMGIFFGSSIVLSPSVTTCYTVSGFSSQGCGYGNAAGCISVVPVNTISVSGNSGICSGSSVNLFAIGALSYTWLPGNLTGSVVSVTPSTSVCYTVVGTQSTGCVALGYHCVQSVPNPTITSSGGVFCSGSQAVLHAQGASSYTWLPFGLTGSSISITPSVSMCYTVIGSNGIGCTSSASNCFSVQPLPVITVSGNSNICAGNTTTLSANGAGSFIWLPQNTSGSSIVVSPSVSTCYTVIGMNGNCSSSALKCVTVQPGAAVTISGNNVICAGTSANLLASGATTYTWNTGSSSPFITVSPSVSTCYTVSGTNANGCTGSAVKCISVQAVPVINISGPNSICFGYNATFVASGASSYLWNTGSTSNIITVAPSTSTVYTVTGTNGICSSVKSKTLVVNPSPTIYVYRTDSIFNNDSVICAGNPAHLYAYGASSFTWSNGATSPYITVYPNVTTTYTVIGTNTYGCASGNAITLIVSACTGISKNADNTGAGIEMYPNPSTGKFTLKGDGSAKIKYNIYDLLGKELVKGELTDEKNIDLSGYANGTYVIRFNAGSVMTYKKIILEK